jgi:hypothetical protein
MWRKWHCLISHAYPCSVIITSGVVEIPFPNFTVPGHGNVIITCAVEKMRRELIYVGVKC